MIRRKRVSELELVENQNQDRITFPAKSKSWFLEACHMGNVGNFVILGMILGKSMILVSRVTWALIFPLI